MMAAAAAAAAPGEPGTETRSVRVGIASFAHMHAWSYVSWLRRLPGAELAGFFEDDPERRRKAAGTLEGVAVWESLAALAAAQPDGVIVCAENVRHRELAEAALEAGIPVLCEKPLATTLADGRAMVEKARARGVFLATAFPCRFHPAAERARRALIAGEIGELRAVSATNHGQVPPGWFTDPALSGGGALMDHTVHVVDLLRWMTGCEIASVYAEKGKLREDLAVEDLGILSCELTDGTVATLDASWSRPGSFPTWGDVTMEFMGAKGVLSLDLFAQIHAVYRSRDGGPGRAADWAGARPVSWVNWGDDMDRGLVADFVEAIRDGRPPLVSGEDGLRALEVALAAYASAESGEPVALPLSGERATSGV